jgi:hypothetical protein
MVEFSHNKREYFLSAAAVFSLEGSINVTVATQASNQPWWRTLAGAVGCFDTESTSTTAAQSPRTALAETLLQAFTFPVVRNPATQSFKQLVEIDAGLAAVGVGGSAIALGNTSSG